MLKKLLASAFFFILSFAGFAQDPEQSRTLYSILQELEKTYDVTFSFADDVIAGKQVTPLAEKTALSDWLQHLELQTRLQFELINEHFIAIREVTMLCGRLWDETTNEPVPFASVSGSTDLVISDDQGFFKISTQDVQDSLRISHVAYLPVKISIAKLMENPCQRISMKPGFTSLPEVVINNYLVSGISKTKGGAFIMNPQEQQILPGLAEPDVLFTLQAFPGIKSVAESVSDINIRGGTNDQNLILWDGIRMFQTGHFFGLISAFNPHITNRAVLDKNGTSAVYGEGVSGTIRMHSKGTPADSLSGGAGTNLLHSDLNLQMPVSPKLSVGLSARRSVTDWLSTKTYQSYFERAFQHTELDRNADSILTSDDQFYFYDWHARINYRISERDRLRITALQLFNQLEYQESARVDGRLETQASELKQKSFGAGIFYKRFWNPKLKTSVDGYVSTYKLASVNQDIPNNQTLIQENGVVDILLKGKVQLMLNSNLDLLGGYAFDQIGIGNLEELNNPAFRRYIRNVLNAHFLFAEANYTSSDAKTLLQTGIRASYYPRINRQLLIEPRISFSHHLTGQLSVELLGEMKNQTMSQLIDLQNDFLGVEKRRWTLANGEDIPVARSSQISLGLHYDKQGFLISVEGYHKEVKGIITSGQAFQNQFEGIRSTGSYKVKGLDLLIRQAFDPLALWVSYSLAKNDYLFEALYPEAFPHNLDVRHHVFLGSSYKKGPFQSSLGLNWHSGRPFTQPVSGLPVSGGRINYQAPNSSRIRDYFRVDISSTYQFPVGRNAQAQVGISIWNLTARENVVSTFYTLSENEDVPRRFDRMALGFTPNALFRVWF